MDISKHPLLKRCSDLCHAIERCGASPELTDAVTQASALMVEIESVTDEVAALRNKNECLKGNA